MVCSMNVRRRRTERAGGDRLRIVDRDLEILEAVGKLRFTTTSQLVRLYFHSRSGANKRLRKLLDAGLVKVWLRQLAEENVYSLTRDGLKTLDASGISVPRELDGNLGHLLMLNEVRIRFALGLEPIGGSLAWWRSEWDLRAHGKERIIPDALFAVSWEEAEQIFALEVENQSSYPQGILRKLLGYRATPELYGTKRYRILIVGRHPPTLARYRQGVLAAGIGKESWFARLEDIGDFREDIWEAGGEDRNYSFRTLLNSTT
jgi:hypothetical protein